MTLTRVKKRELRDLGWLVVRRKSERPRPVRTRDVLRVGEHVTVDEQTQDHLLMEVEAER